MRPTTKWNKKYLLGIVSNENIYLRPPSWDGDWYWGFGYLGNRNCHYHLDGLNRNRNLYDALKEHFGDTLTIPEKYLWKFCELVKTTYALKEAAEVLGRGGSHYSNNPCRELIKNTSEVERINNIVLPAIFNEIAELMDNRNNN